MKTILKYDYFLQLTVLILSVSWLSVDLIFLKGYNFFWFYPLVGLTQLFSFIVRLFIPYKKTSLFILYGIIIMPVWIAIFLVLAFNLQEAVVSPMLLLMIAALFLSPPMAILYVLDCRAVYKRSIYRIQKFLNLVN